MPTNPPIPPALTDIRLFGFGIVLSPDMPKGQLDIVQGQKIVGRIIGISDA